MYHPRGRTMAESLLSPAQFRLLALVACITDCPSARVESGRDQVGPPPGKPVSQACAHTVWEGRQSQYLKHLSIVSETCVRCMLVHTLRLRARHYRHGPGVYKCRSEQAPHRNLVAYMVVIRYSYAVEPFSSVLLCSEVVASTTEFLFTEYLHAFCSSSSSSPRTSRSSSGQIHHHPRSKSRWSCCFCLLLLPARNMVIRVAANDLIWHRKPSD